MSKPIPIVHHPDYIVTLPADSRFPMDKYSAVVAAIEASGAIVAWHQPEPTPLAALTAAHDADYVAAVLAQSLSREAQRRIGFPVTEQVARRARLVSGGTWLAARLALHHGVACNSAGGSHHAHAGFGSGYCVFNDVAIAAQRLLVEGTVKRLLIIDLDVHQGDGTAAIFASDARVFTFSIHCEANFPARKQASDLDIGLPPGLGDAAYLETLQAHVPTVLRAHEPDLIFYIAGVDPHADDRLGRLSLSDAGLSARDSYIGRMAGAAGIPMAVVMGGGYGTDKSELGARHARALLDAACSHMAQ